MDLLVKIMNKTDTIASILQFQTDNTSPYWRKRIFNIYPFLNEEKALSLYQQEREEYLSAELANFYDTINAKLEDKLKKSQKIWSDNKKNVNDVFSAAFKIDCSHLLNDMIAEISLNPICPRNLDTHTFSVFWDGDEHNFMKTALHEMIHFVWFYLWQQYFNDNKKEYESPNLKWLLSEMVIDTFVKHTEIGKVFPEIYKAQPAYSYFYDMKINDMSVLTLLSEMYKNAPSIQQFMKLSYEYCLQNENILRDFMKKASG